jgi:hypothetical protein
MTARELYHAGQLTAAIQALSGELRDNPTDMRRRTFLFELLCFAGEYDRAQKHLDVLATQGPDAATGALLYRAALNADRMRTDLFTRRDYPEARSSDAPVSGTDSHSNRSPMPIRASALGWKSTPRASACGCRSRTSHQSRSSRQSGYATCCGHPPCCTRAPRSKAPS